MRLSLRTALLTAAIGAVLAPCAMAQPLAGAPEPPMGPPMMPPPGDEGPPPMPPASMDRHMDDGGRFGPFGRPGQGRGAILPRPPAYAHPGECYGRVRMGPDHGPPPGGPQGGWSQPAGPAEGPGPVWCRSPQAGPPPPEQFGWVRVVCEGRMGASHVHRWRAAHARPSRKPAHRTMRPHAMRHIGRMRHESRVEHYGYMHEEIVRSIEPPPPPPMPMLPPPCAPCKPHHGGPAPTTFETGYITWPGKVRF